MDANKILKMVDRTIIQSFKVGNDIDLIKRELENRSNNFKKVLLKDQLNIDELLKSDWSDISTSRVRYGTFYIRSCSKRIKDLDWILNNRVRFSNKTEEQIFKLLNLKDRLSIDPTINI